MSHKNSELCQLLQAIKFLSLNTTLVNNGSAGPYNKYPGGNKVGALCGAGRSNCWSGHYPSLLHISITLTKDGSDFFAQGVKNCWPPEILVLS